MPDPTKDEDLELPVPNVWRPTLKAIVDSLVRRDSRIGVGLPSVTPASADTTRQCLQAVDDYGEVALIPLPEKAWETSVTRWFGDHWDCLVDLWTEEEGRSDLVLELDVWEDMPGYRFCIHLVYVP